MPNAESYQRALKVVFDYFYRLLRRYLAVGGRTSQHEIFMKIIFSDAIEVGGARRYIRVLEVAKGRSGIFGANIFIAFKLDEHDADFPSRVPGAFRDTFHDVRLTAGEERLGDQVFFFTFSRWKNIERNYRILVDFIREEYIEPRQRSRENAYFREILMSNRNENNQ
jgi:hypothetical protein